MVGWKVIIQITRPSTSMLASLSQKN